MLIYGLKNCDKCRAARKVLQNAEFVDIPRSAFFCDGDKKVN